MTIKMFVQMFTVKKMKQLVKFVKLKLLVLIPKIEKMFIGKNIIMKNCLLENMNGRLEQNR
jgi:hypothetical protein